MATLATSGVSTFIMFIILHLLVTQIIHKTGLNVLGFNSKTITIDPLPILMLFTDVVIHAHSTLEILVTSRAIIFFIRTNVEFTHVSLHAVEKCIPFPTNHANKASITFLNLALHQVIQRKGLFF